MGTLFRLISLSLLILATFQLNACKKNGEQAVPQKMPVSATGAYEKYFGPPPTTDKGTCFAFVIYFPSAKDPGKVVPFPFFTFDGGTIKKVAVERFLSGMDVPAYRGEILLPFQPGIHLLGLEEAKGSVIVNFSRELLALRTDTACYGAVLDALALTLTQFKGVKDVRIAVEGKGGVISFAHGCLIRQPLTADSSAVLDPSPPRLLDIVAARDRTTKMIEDVNINFDRPVEIRELTITDKNGSPFAGEMYQSVFDMAAVLKPKDPSAFKAGMTVEIRWKAVDKLGRAAEGRTDLPLEIREH